METLKKKKSHFRYEWHWDSEIEWYLLKKIKNKDNSLVEEHIIVKQDKETWNNVLKNDGWERVE
jgi:hypothetical protein